MTEQRQKLPIGIQTFAKIREGDYYYVDKTPIACQLADTSGYYFLSRPRRFGKSLFLDTLKELFEGNQPLFKGLAAEQQWDWSKKHPVIRISFAEGVLHSVEALQSRILEILDDEANNNGLSYTTDSIVGRFIELIRHSHQQRGQKVVILIDEYDKPILDNLTHSDQARAMRDELRNFYSVIKGQDALLRFVFLTGVSKFSKVSLFSGLNNLRDITLSPEYSAICGYTEADLERVFASELDGLDRDQVRQWYNGYNWLGESVYNPFDLLLLFQEREFRAFWFETGTPTFLIDLLQKRQTFTPELSQLVTMETLISRFDVDDMPTEALMFQTGYLTIAEQFRMGALTEYTLKYPNKEVQASLNGVLLEMLMGNPSLPHQFTGKLYRLLAKGDVTGLQLLLKSLFASIPYDWQRSNPIANYEGYYASVFYSYFAALGLDIRLEDITNKGRIDMTVLFNEQVFLFEFKVVEEVPEGKALQQIIDKGYADKYRHLKQPIHLIGVEFSKTERQIVGFEVATDDR
ncbi:PD-(D/E)XK nuclease superfamily protein [Allopseudospirillum japonicum]|uniref:PD-(D/E)XK nuclease superfamily protein n=1 Tax=Allopseudospirillum japonicum TaxID=64971 RepID=A0A1H6UNN5_9GAMM|nr:ATP-binding protein [Allopseudospirillum japonicum]SEI93888.1 PD-(D/E)XK nuclease superfamily protein [Allopseudospirillum japonicum]